MPPARAIEWEPIPDDSKLVDLLRCQLPEGWLVYASGMGGKLRFGGLVHYRDAKHDWQPPQGDAVLGARRRVKWESLGDLPDGFGARLNVPGGWLVLFDFEAEGSAAQLTFCPDDSHAWTLRASSAGGSD